MLTEFTLDHVFNIAFFGLMSVVWFGWGQEDPPRRWRWRLGIGSVLGFVFTAVFGYAYALRMDGPSALEGRYEWFGGLFAVEIVVATIGVVYLWRSGRARWMAWWVALVVAAHFLPLAFVLGDASLFVLGLIQIAALGATFRSLRSGPADSADAPTSRIVGPVMGGTFLAFAAVSALTFVVTHGSPW